MRFFGPWIGERLLESKDPRRMQGSEGCSFAESVVGGEGLEPPTPSV